MILQFEILDIRRMLVPCAREISKYQEITMIYFIKIYDCAFYFSSIPVEDACNFFLKTVNNLWGN